MIYSSQENIVKIVKNKYKFTLLPMYIITWWFLCTSYLVGMWLLIHIVIEFMPG